MCCYAVKHGVAKDELSPRSKASGKFAERGRGYFDVTWQNAEHRVRLDVLYHAERGQRNAAPHVTPERDAGSGERREIMGTASTPATIRRAREADASSRSTPRTRRWRRRSAVSRRNCCRRVVLHAHRPTRRHPRRADQAGPSRRRTGRAAEPARRGLLRRGRRGRLRPFPPTTATPGSTTTESAPTSGHQAVHPQPRLHRRLAAGGARLRRPVGHLLCRARESSRARAPSISTACCRTSASRRSADRTNYIGMLLTALLMPPVHRLQAGGAVQRQPAGARQVDPGPDHRHPARWQARRDGDVQPQRRGVREAARGHRPPRRHDDHHRQRQGARPATHASSRPASSGRSPTRSCRSACWATRRTSGPRTRTSSASRPTTPDVSRDLLTRSVVINLLLRRRPDARTFSIRRSRGLCPRAPARDCSAS